MLTRRAFAAVFSEAALARRAVVRDGLAKDMVWLNANENPAGPPPASLRAMADAAPASGRYHFQEFGDFYQAVARSEGLDRSQVVVGAGSSELLALSVLAFTTSARPLIIMNPTFEGPAETARALGRPIVPVPLNVSYAADVRRMAAQAAQAGGGLIYLCNPNNPTGAVTPKDDVAWLVDHLPPNTVLLVDEAYIHFADTPRMESALGAVRRGRNVIVTRTFSKIHGMAGLRVGFACARPDFAARLASLRSSVLSIVSTRAVAAALAEGRPLLDTRRADYLRRRRALYGWLRDRKLPYIESHGNFVMIDVGRSAAAFGAAMAQFGVVPGRRFPPLDNFLRVTIGTDAEMERFRDVFWKVYRS